MEHQRRYRQNSPSSLAPQPILLGLPYADAFHPVEHLIESALFRALLTLLELN
jgi:hypothetical protein